MVSNRTRAERHNAAGVGLVTDRLGSGIKCCEVALSSGSTSVWERKIKHAQKAHDTALRFVHRFDLSEHEVQRISQRITHLRTLLEELR
jgi:hypothetical protein